MNLQNRHIFEAAQQLFKEYIDFLYGLPNMRVHIDKQNPRAELAELEKGNYSPPDGAIFWRCMKGHLLGVVALRKLADGICEMKRLYVRPKFRGSSIGLQLVQKIIQKSGEIGYQKMRLDTLSAMTKAHQLYYFTIDSPE